MDTKDDEFLKRINATFRVEAGEHLNAFSTGLISLEKKQSHEKYAGIIEVLFREIHSLKGAARAVDQKEIEAICQPLESAFSTLKNNNFIMSANAFDIFHKTADVLLKLVSQPVSEITADERQSQRELIRNLKEVFTADSVNVGIKQPDSNDVNQIEELIPVSFTTKKLVSETSIIEKSKASETVRIQIAKLDPLLLQAEELIQAKKAINQRLVELQEIVISISDRKSELLKWKKYPLEIDSPDWNKWYESSMTCQNNLEVSLNKLTRLMKQDKYSLDGMVDTHLEEMRQVLMLPVSSIVETFPGMVREISREQNKNINFIIRGEELEMDKRILEELKDPLIHIIRNSIDHGIGTPGERFSQNKTPDGTIILEFTARESRMIEITLSDDGIGISKNKLKEAAIKSGNITREIADKMTPSGIMNLVYKSGVSTSPVITEISGRGLGLSIAYEKVLKLNGEITANSEENEGTSFHILVPSKLTTFRGIMVSVAATMFILPTNKVERVLKMMPENIKTVKNHETINYNDQILSLVSLAEILGLPEHEQAGVDEAGLDLKNPVHIRILVLVSGEQRIGFKVDEILDEQQVLVKGLGKLIKKVRNISGATILGSGKVVPVLNIPDLIRSALIAKEKIRDQKVTLKAFEKIKKILVADDSITSRTLLKSILETAGYIVTTAIDGMDAFSKAHTNTFNLIVSDVDMPRMNGFELITKIRNEKRLSEIPVILVTSLGSREDHERGVEVGADAYIVKSNFDQANLLETIRKLI